MFYNPVKVIWGQGKVRELSNIIKENNLSINNVLIVTGKGSIEKSGTLDIILEKLKNVEVNIYSGIKSNPEISELYNIKKETDDFKYDTIIAIGGGSVLDIGKSLATFKNINIRDENELKEYIINKNYSQNEINTKIIAIPTTAGTGSEVTSWATIWDKENNNKYSVEDIRTYPDIAIIDPELTLSLPINLTVSTALDAVSHAMEAYWAKKTNEIVRLYSLKSIELIMNNLSSLLDNLNNIKLREKIALGSMLAGLAFSNTRTTVCHSISYPLTSMYNIPHGIATSMTLGKVLDINKDLIIEKELLLNAFNVRSISEVEEVIINIFKKTNIKYRLKDYGVDKKDIPLIVKKSFTPGRSDNNPVEITEEIMENILQHVY